VRVDVEAELPRFVLTRLRKDDRSRYFGPFAYSSLVRKTLAEMRRRFGILLGDAHPVKTAGDVYRLYDDVRAELYGHANEVTAADYRHRVEAACEFLEGKSREWLEALRAEMQAAAARQEFERAAKLRDVVAALE
jgi:excinuclease ABC subunit C